MENLITKNLITIKDMYKSFFGVVAMDGMNFSIGEGQIRCLIGENGCGKSTMIKVISGYYEYDEGELWIEGTEYRKITPSESMALGIQVIYQDFALFSSMTIAENIMMYESVGAGRPFVNRRKMREGALNALKKIKFDMDVDRYLYELNVAEQQIVAICRAIVQDAKLIVMDEPTAALTASEVRKLFDVIKELKNHGVSVLFVSHKLDEVLELSDAITVMRNGRNVYQSEIGSPLPSKEQLVQYMTGREIEDSRFDFIPSGEAPVFEVKGYTLGSAFRDVSFALQKGEILGITGLLGSGRAELAESLFGVTPAESGEILIGGESAGILKDIQDALKHNIAYVPDDRLTKGLHLNQSIADNSVARVIGRFANGAGVLDIKALREQIFRGLDTIHIAGMRPGNPARSLSGGNQQKVVLIKWLAAKPEILILNCPTIGVDVGAKNEIHSIVKDLARQGIGVIVISDDIPEVMQTCNRVLIMKEGRVSDEIRIKDSTLKQIEETLSAGLEMEGEAV